MQESFPFPRLRRSNSVRIGFNETLSWFFPTNVFVQASREEEKMIVKMESERQRRREEGRERNRGIEKGRRTSWRSSSWRAIEQHLPGSHDCLAIAVPTCFEHATQFVCVSLFYRSSCFPRWKSSRGDRDVDYYGLLMIECGGYYGFYAFEMLSFFFRGDIFNPFISLGWKSIILCNFCDESV